MDFFYPIFLTFRNMIKTHLLTQEQMLPGAKARSPNLFLNMVLASGLYELLTNFDCLFVIN